MTVVVQPIRFTDNVVEMRAYLELLGLSIQLESVNGAWVDLAAGAGRAALHSASGATSGAKQGETHLSFETDDVQALAAALIAAGVPNVVVYDEAYNQSLSCTDPLGHTVVVNGESSDLYGYQLLDAKPDPRWKVTAVRFAAPRGPYAAFLGALGFAPTIEPNDYYVNFEGHGRAGIVGLHHADFGALPIPAGNAGVQLCFETSEPLDEVAARLTAAGYADVSLAHEDFGDVLSLTDPDGIATQIHQPTHA